MSGREERPAGLRGTGITQALESGIPPLLGPWRLDSVKGAPQKEGTDETPWSEEVTGLYGPFTSSLKALLNHNQITVNCRFLLKQESPIAFLLATLVSGDRFTAGVGDR